MTPANKDRLHLPFQITAYLGVAASLVMSSYFDPSTDDSIHTTSDNATVFLVLAIVLFGIAKLEKSFYKARLEERFWTYLAASYPPSQGSDIPPAGPVILSDASDVTAKVSRRLALAAGRDVLVSDVWTTFPVRSGGQDSPQNTFRLRYLVLAIDLKTPTPHIFIDGRSQNHFGGTKSDLWSLTKRLSRAERLQDMEGDFYKFFDVYASNRDYLSAFTIIAPDIMLVLRNKGYSFDYEIHNGFLYVIHEMSLLRSERDYQALIAAFNSCVDELIPQVTKHSYADIDAPLTIGNRRLRLWAFWYSVRISFAKVGKALLFALICVVIGQSLAS
ncbi:MAG: hypothetical protein JWN38_1085 [Candidatus Saccharibacteria bacterium]|nr:hypothetical protein [Candidatus Saccharibacteria bacterium]